VRDFGGKVAVITGAGSGIGRALALALAKEGAELALSDIDTAGLAETVHGAEAFGVRVSQQRLDVAQREAVFAHAARVVQEHGRVNLVVNNAGVALDATIGVMRYEDLEWLMGINFWGVVHGTKAFLPHLIASGDGHIVNLSSVFGLIAVPGQSAYNAAKFAVRGFTECLRQELELEGQPVSATCVHPGGVRTNIVRRGRIRNGASGLSQEDAIEQFEQAARTTPEQAARKILRAVRRNKRRVLVGPEARPIDWLQRLAPAGYQRLLVAGLRRSRRG